MPRKRQKYLLFIPLLTYFCSYVYLACYHQKAFLFFTVIHEGGTHTLLETIFYASHFLGHVPMLTVISMIFVGTCLCLARIREEKPRFFRISRIGIGIAGLLIIAIVISLAFFGGDDTLNFLLQRKQGVNIYQEGGSWDLHVPSTFSLIFLIPVYVSFCLVIFRIPVSPNRRGLGILFSGLLIFLIFSLALNRNHLGEFIFLVISPRYLAHSVRELATFPLTFFPLPLYFFLRSYAPKSQESAVPGWNLHILIVICGVIFLALLILQSIPPLQEGIGNLAQQPSFARGGKLGIPYLLASHYFEHLLDTIFFTLASLLLYRFAIKKPG